MKNIFLRHWLLFTLAAVVILVYIKRAELKRFFVPGSAEAQALQNSAAVMINNDFLMEIGAKGAEVSKLQTLLGIPASGIFDQMTQNALFAQRGVKAISLNQWYGKVPVLGQANNPNNFYNTGFTGGLNIQKGFK